MAEKYEVFQEKRCFEHTISVEKGATFKIINNKETDKTYIRTLAVDQEPEDLPDNWQILELVAAVAHKAVIKSGIVVNLVTDGAGNQYLELPSEDVTPEG